MNKFTSGPWEIGDDCQVQTVDVNGYEIAEIRADVPEYEANAALIAAAPDLLAALEDMLAGWKYIRESHGDLYGVGWDRAQDKATAAITKARGEA